MEYIDLITMGLLVALFVVLYVKQPNRLYKVVMKSVLEDVRSNQKNITSQIYNKLPNELKEKITSEEFITMIAHFMNVIIEVLEETVREDKK